MAEFDKRIAAGSTSKADAPARLETVSLDRRPSLAVPAVLMAEAPAERPVQIAQNPMVPLRRPGDSGSGSSSVPAPTSGPSPIGGPSSPVAPGTYGGPAYGGPAGGPASLTPAPLPAPPAGPSSSAGDADPLSREISRELATLEAGDRDGGRGRPGLPRSLG